jgi:hypothetical protein
MKHTPSSLGPETFAKEKSPLGHWTSYKAKFWNWSYLIDKKALVDLIN